MLNNVQITVDGVTHRWLIDVQQYSRVENFHIMEDRPFNAGDVQFTNQLRAIAGLGSGNLLDRVKAALVINVAYAQKVNAGTATNADHIAHVQMLNRQLSALMVYTVLNGDDA